MVVKSAAAQKEHFLSCAIFSYFLVLFVKFFFIKPPQKQVFLHNVMNLTFLHALLFFGWENFAMMVPKKDSRQLVRPYRTQKRNKEEYHAASPFY